MAKVLPIPDLDEHALKRFWAFVKKGNPNECWPWIGSRHKSGYGRFKLSGETYYPHRIMFAITHRDRPGLLICHECDNPECVNPDHLYDQPAKENAKDAIVRGRRGQTYGCPLYLHPSGQWAKRVRGKTYYFGRDRKEAIARWEEERGTILSGREPVRPSNSLDLRTLVNQFLESKELLVESGELSLRTWTTYYETSNRLLAVFGKTRAVESLTTGDFERLRASLAKGRGVVSLGNEIQRVRSIFKYAWDQGLIATPVRFGVIFKKPSAKIMRAAKHTSESWIIEAEDLRRLLDAAGVQLRAMILLGINCGFGNTDISSLPLSALNLKGGWVAFPRTKTATPRRAKLWPETVAAIEEAIARRPRPSAGAHADRVFLTQRGVPWVRVQSKGPGKPGVVCDAVREEFDKLLTRLDLKRKGRAFYSLRHTFRTIADGAQDQPAAAMVMGHTDSTMAGVYRNRIDDERLERVSEMVRDWLWPKPKLFAPKSKVSG